MTACQTCGQQIPYQGRGRPRKYCLSCKPRAARPQEPTWDAPARWATWLTDDSDEQQEGQP